jgi:crotonobetainyl-CoA:carnitine CoA-transferase CaiB-like acyl-CoA transferase
LQKVLSGIKVLEQGTFITGPAAGMFLADLGAEVIKVEQPGSGDPFRAFRGGLYSPHFQTYNRNKRSITLNPKLPDDAAVFDALVKESDVYIQNFRPGAAERLGAGAARLRGLNPRLVYCAISGFGQTGPAAGRPAYDTVAQAASAFLKLLVNPANPRVVGPAVADAMTGFYAAYGVMGALVERGRTGVGRTVEVSMLEAMCHFNLDAFTHYFSENEIMGPFSRPSVSQSYVLECADGLWIALHMSSPEKFWQGLANAIERPDLFQDPRFANREGRIAHQTEMIALLDGLWRWCATRMPSRARWTSRPTSGWPPSSSSPPPARSATSAGRSSSCCRTRWACRCWWWRSTRRAAPRRWPTSPARSRPRPRCRARSSGRARPSWNWAPTSARAARRAHAVPRRVTDTFGKPLANCELDVWSGDDDGFYDMQKGDSMSLRAQFRTDKDGNYRFWSIKPTFYPVPVDGPVGRMLAAWAATRIAPATCT